MVPVPPPHEWPAGRVPHPCYDQGMRIFLDAYGGQAQVERAIEYWRAIAEKDGWSWNQDDGEA